MKQLVCKWIEATKGGLVLLESCRAPTPWRRNSSIRATHAPRSRFFVSDLLGSRPSTTPDLYFPKPSSIAFSVTVQFHRYTSTTSASTSADHTRREIQQMASISGEPVGQSGCRYLIQRVLQEKEIPPCRVYLATYVLKLNCQHVLIC